MSQSNPFYGAEGPKDSARAHRRRPDTPAETDDSEPTPQPACRSRHVEKWDWHAIPYTDRVLASYRLCEWPECFGDGPPDASTTETVIRSQRAPTVIHRPHEPDTYSQATDKSHGHGYDQHPDARAREIETRPADYESVTAVAELRLGDGVIWETLDTPKVVIERNDESPAVTLEGPAGGEFVLRERYDSELLVYPGHGCVSASRIPADGRPERA